MYYDSLFFFLPEKRTVYFDNLTFWSFLWFLYIDFPNLQKTDAISYCSSVISDDIYGEYELTASVMVQFKHVYVSEWINDLNVIYRNYNIQTKSMWQSVWIMWTRCFFFSRNKSYHKTIALSKDIGWVQHSMEYLQL